MKTIIKVAIIDDGVDANKYKLSGNWIVDNSEIIPKSQQTINIADNHATMCCNIIYKYTNNAEIELYSLQILDSQSRQGNIKNFISALNFCLKLNIKLIHLSIGTRYFRDFEPVKSCINSLIKNNIIVVAACSNQGTITYPACISNVIGVKHNSNLKDDQYYFYNNPFDGINIHASSFHIYRDGKEIKYSPVSNSFSAPLITGKIILYLLKNPTGSIREVQKYLFFGALNIMEYENYIPEMHEALDKIVLLNIYNDNESEYKNTASLREFPLSVKCKQYSVNCNNLFYENKRIHINKYDWVILNLDYNVLNKAQIMKWVGDYDLRITLLYNDLSLFLDKRSQFSKDRKWIGEKYNFYREERLNKQIEMPVILFINFKQHELIHLLLYLKDRFIQNEYFCNIALNIPHAKMLGFHIIPKEVNLSYDLKYICNFLECDILLLGQIGKITLQSFREFSIIIKKDINTNYVIFPEFKENPAEIIFSNNNFEWLYNNIISILT